MGIHNGTVIGIGVIDSYIKGGSYIGGVAEYLYAGAVSDCYNAGVVTSMGDYIDGIAGHG